MRLTYESMARTLKCPQCVNEHSYVDRENENPQNYY